MRLLEPFTRNVPSISVAETEPSDASAILYVMQHQTEQPAHRSPSKTNHCNDIGPEKKGGIGNGKGTHHLATTTGI
jgi:hypothetical protein